MTDRDHADHAATIARYREAIPQPDPSYHAELRDRLAAAPVQRSRRLPSMRWRWTAGASVAAALALAVTLLLVPFGPRGSTPLSPRAVLARAVTAAQHLEAYRTTAELSFSSRVDNGPGRLTRDLGTRRIIVSSAVRDMTHWRVDGRTALPVLQSGRYVAVADGGAAIYYTTLTNRASRFALKPRFIGAALLSEFQGSYGMPVEQTLAEYLRELNNPKLSLHGRYIGKSTALGRTADVIEIWPVSRGSVSVPCKAGRPCRNRTRQVGYGRARMWIDEQHGLLLRYEVHGLPAGYGEQHMIYRVTAVTFGSGPTPAALSYRPPVTPVTRGPSSGSFGNGGYSYGGANSSIWHAPKGFIPVRGPIGSRGLYALSGQGQSSTSGFGIDSANAFFTEVPAANPTGPIAGLTPPPGGPFLYIQEQSRANGMPRALASGTPHAAGACTVYTGTYPDGIHWLALERRHIILLAAADQLDEAQLTLWAATRVCA